MSEKISVVFLSFILVLSFFSCSHKNTEVYSSVLERSFSCKVSVRRDDTEYVADVTLYGRGETVSTETGRDGSIVYLSPDSLSDITASRTGGCVSVNVSGIIVTPSEKVGARYAALLDVLDMRACEMLECKPDKTGERAVMCVSFYHSDKNYTLLVDESTAVPISLEGDGISVRFSDFIYIA